MTKLFNYEVAGKVEVLVTGSKVQNNVNKFITNVTDIVEGSPTKGWSLEYTPRLNSQGELYEPSQTFNSITVPNFSTIQDQVFGAVVFFAQDSEVNSEIQSGKQRVRRVYESENNPYRITVSKQRNSFYVLLRVVDATSPFYMVALEFTVTPDKMNPNQPYIVGINQRLNAATGAYTSYDAFFVDSKRMFVEVYRNNNNYNLANTRIIGQDQNGYTIDNRNTSIQYIQKVDTIFKAQAFIVEQSIMEYAFAVAKEQTVNVQTQQQQAANTGLGAFFNQGQAMQQPQFNQQAGGFQQTPPFPNGAPVMNQQLQGFQAGQQFQGYAPNPQTTPINAGQPFNPGFTAPQPMTGFAPQQTAFVPQQPQIEVSDLPPGL